ncbi:sialate O-acetylesterase [Adhaeretor mobilis]|nr:sialate O-acetylesterase [Adhaeretor mobilis]
MRNLNLINFFRAIVVLTCLAPLPCFAEVKLPNIFGDHMVLQQGQQNKVWGKAEPGEQVTVKIHEQSQQTTANDAGLWSVLLDPLPVGGPYTLKVSGTNEISIDDVLVGEVWICSGQSNMQWVVNKVYDADLVKAEANYPRIRMINFPNVGSQEPVWKHDKAAWQLTTPESVGAFSAVGYFFGRQLHNTIDVPIGLINNSWGGSAADAWVNRDVLAEQEFYQETMNKWKQREEAYNDLALKTELSEQDKKKQQQLRGAMFGNQRPANIYNGVLKSHLGYGIKGAIWYQGESNASRAYQYRKLFPLMISNWRDEWGQGDFPFYWVQLADFQAEQAEPGDSAWAELREAQTMTIAALPNTGEAVIINEGEGYDIHPRNKLIVGQRLARWALAKQYDIGIPCQSPTFSSMEKQDGKIVLSFTEVHKGWRPFDVKKPLGFAIAGEDKKFVWAEAKILKDQRIEVSSKEVSNPVAVRYAWANNPVCNLFDGVGLPLTPFRTDDWPGVTVDNR